MQAPLTDRNDIKIFILYLMKAVGEPLDFVDINDIVVQNGIVSPFDFLDCFPELVKTGHIRLLEKENHTFYQLTALGSETVDSLESTLLNMTKESAKKNAFMLLELKKKNSDIRFGVEPDLNGGYQFWCNYYKNNRPGLVN